MTDLNLDLPSLLKIEPCSSSKSMLTVVVFLESFVKVVSSPSFLSWLAV